MRKGFETYSNVVDLILQVHYRHRLRHIYTYVLTCGSGIYIISIVDDPYHIMICCCNLTPD